MSECGAAWVCREERVAWDVERVWRRWRLVDVELTRRGYVSSDFRDALDRVEAVIEAARGIDPEFMGHEALAPLRAALAALNEGGET